MQLSMRPLAPSLGAAVQIRRQLCSMLGPQRPALTIQTSKMHLRAHQPESVAGRAAALSAAAATAEPDRKHASWFESMMNSLSKAALVVGLVVALALSTAGNAFAAKTSGRVGGSSFGRTTMRSSAPSPSMTRSTQQVHHHHTTVVHAGPSWGFGWGMPSIFMPISPFGYGHHNSGGSAIMTLLLFAVVAFIALQAFKAIRSPGASNTDDDEEDEAMPPVTVAKVQIGLLAIAKDIKSDLNALAAGANTSSPEGLHLLLQETVIALLRNPSVCAYGTSSSQLMEEPEAAERLFNSWSIEERGKVQQETLVNYAGMQRSKTVKETSSDGPAELIVVNLMVAVEGDLQLPAVRSLSDLQQVMSKLGSVPARDIMGVEVFWTPQADNDVLTQQQCLLQYPTLRPL